MTLYGGMGVKHQASYLSQGKTIITLQKKHETRYDDSLQPRHAKQIILFARSEWLVTPPILARKPCGAGVVFSDAWRDVGERVN